MNGAKDSFLEFGGHAGAGGFSVTLEQITKLEEKLSEMVWKHSVSKDAQTPSVEETTKKFRFHFQTSEKICGKP